jgi:hypothetical protein
MVADRLNGKQIMKNCPTMRCGLSDAATQMQDIWQTHREVLFDKR